MYRFLLFPHSMLACPHHSAQLESSHAAPYYIRMLEGFKLFARSQSATHLMKCLESVPLFLQYLAPWHLKQVSRCHKLRKIYCDGEIANLSLRIWCANSNFAC